MEDYEHQTSSGKQALDFEVTTKFIINHVQETFDIGKGIDEALRLTNGPIMAEWRPTMSESTSEDEATRDRESEEFELDCNG